MILYKIAFVTKNKEPFVNLTPVFEENKYKVSFFDTDECCENHLRLLPYDFICLNLENNAVKNQNLIPNIRKKIKAPIYIFGHGHSEVERVDHIKLGALGYIETPYSPLEIFTRVHAILSYLRSLKGRESFKITYGPVEVDVANHQIKNHHRIHNLTKVEYKIITILLDNKDQTVTKDRIINYVWDNDKSATDNALGIHIARLRKKLDFGYHVPLIETIWGVGYRLNFSLFKKNGE